MNTSKYGFDEPEENSSDSLSRRESERSARSLTEAAMIRPGVELAAQHTRIFRGKNRAFVAWAIFLVIVTMILSIVSAGLMKRAMPPVFAYSLSALSHAGLALGAHFLVIGFERRNRFKAWGIGFVSFCLCLLVVLSFARINTFAGLGYGLSAARWMTLFLFLVESFLPFILGFVLALLDMAKGEAKDDMEYFGKFKGQLEKGADARGIWRNAIAHLDEDIDDVEQDVNIKGDENAHPEKLKLGCLKDRLKMMKQWDPTQPYQRRSQRRRDEDDDFAAGVLRPIR